MQAPPLIALSSLLLLVGGCAAPLDAQETPPTIAGKTEGLDRRAGFLDAYWDPVAGKLWLTVPAFDRELLYSVSLASGLGSNPVGLDRGSLGPQHVVEFRRFGPRVLLVAVNYRYRATTTDPAERRAVADSFAPSVLWGFAVAAESEGRVLIDATEFLLRDAVDAGERLRRAGQGSWSVDADRSMVLSDRCRSFPDNTELESLVTLSSNRGGPLVRQTAATGEAVTLRMHHSFVKLPEGGYRPRVADPRVGYSGVTFADYGTPLSEPLEKRWIARHRLVKRDPAAAVSEPVEPIVYYLDPGVPEPIRSALMEGASWWAKAFEAAGFVDAFRVELLPADADPLDIRYNVIHWVHRSTRGWSYGGSVRDPRTGEILKGNVLLGSLRARQDHLKFVGMQGPYDGCAAAHSPECEHLLQGGQEELATELALARLRQLSAHEVGHTLGLSHNFAASGYGRASVMDYPAPLVEPDDAGELDFSKAYAVGIGRYDEWVIRYGYTQFAEEDEAAGLDAIVREGLAAGYVFLTDQDARAASTGNPLCALWDNGADPVAQLRQEMRVRRIGLSRFGTGNLRPGRTLGELEDVLVPLYLHHRFQLEAALKVLGGVEYRHAVKGDGQPGPRPATEQREALRTVLQTLAVPFLEQGLDVAIPPAAPGHPSHGERFARYSGGPAGAVAMAATAAELSLSGLLQRNRAARLCSAEQAAAGEPHLIEVIEELIAAVWQAEPPGHPRGRLVQRIVQTLTVDHVMGLAADESALPEARAVARQTLAELEAALEARIESAADDHERVHLQDTVRRIHFFLDDPDQSTRRAGEVEVPPGSPIGTDDRRTG